MDFGACVDVSNEEELMMMMIMRIMITMIIVMIIMIKLMVMMIIFILIMINNDSYDKNCASRYECMDFGACVDVSNEEDPMAICECQVLFSVAQYYISLLSRI